MATTWRTYNGLIGSTFIIDPALANTTILKVKREGLGFDVILTGSPGTRQALYTSSTGRITFLDAFLPGSGTSPGPAVSGEVIYVLFKL